MSNIEMKKGVYTEEEIKDIKENNPLRYSIASLTMEGWCIRWDETTKKIRNRKKEIDIINKYKEKRRR